MTTAMLRGAARSRFTGAALAIACALAAVFTSTTAIADDQKALTELNQRVSLLRTSGKINDAIAAAREALVLAERLHGEHHAETVAARSTLTSLLRRAGKVAEADRIEREARVSKKSFVQPQPRSVTATTPPPSPTPGGATPRAAAPVPPPVASAPPPPPAASTPTPRAPVIASLPTRPQLDPAKFAEVPVFFGTNRRRGDDITRNGVKLVAFGNDPQTTLQLGRALVSVPRQGREKGAIPRPASATFWRAAEVEDPNKHFMLVSISLQDKSVFVQSVKDRLAASKGDFKDQALVFVHGFNVNFEDAAYRTAQIAYDLEFDGAPFLFSWPTPEGNFGYVGARDRAMASRRVLREFLDLISQQTNAKRVHLVAHSMGTWPLLDVLREIAEDDQRSNRGQRFQEVVLAAPDMDRENFTAMAGQICPAGPASASRCAGGAAHGVTVYATSNDRALQASMKLSGIDRAGLFDEKKPFILRGIDTIDVSAADTSFFSYNHSQPLERSQLLADIALLMKHGSRPPDQRYNLFERRETSEGGSYWRYNKK